MPLKTGADYINSLQELELRVYHLGKRVDNIAQYPPFKPHINAVAVTYDLAHNNDYQDLMVTKSHLTGEKINRFTHIHQSIEDLIIKVKMLRMLGQRVGSCFQRCTGYDALNALYSVTYEMDQELGTDYFTRFKSYLKKVQREDLMLAGSMTDPKGDRSRRPCQQDDPDLYLRIVDENERGIVVRGAKAHQTGIVNSHEMLVMPTIALKDDEGDYSISFSLPTDAEGVTHIFGRQTNDGRRFECGKIDLGNYKYGFVGGEALTVFDDVFVPWERVFNYREPRYTSALVTRFASYHRQNYGGCKAGIGDVIIGAVSAMAEYNGVEGFAHIKDKIGEMIHMTETVYSGSLACSVEGCPTPSGAYGVDSLLANTVKLNISRYVYDIFRLAHDITGGFVATLPSEADYNSQEVGEYIEKYFRGVPGFSTEERIRMLRLIENITLGTALIESMHGAGSPQIQRLMQLREGDLDYKKGLAKDLAGIKDHDH